MALTRIHNFFAAVNSAVNFDISFESSISQAVNILEKSQSLNSLDSTKCKKLNFITRQLQLLLKKDFLTADYCLALELFPRCTYEHLRDYLVLPSKRKLHSISSSTDVDKVVLKTFEKVHNDQQKNCFLIIDEVKIRPTVAFSRGVLSGTAKNKKAKATGMCHDEVSS